MAIILFKTELDTLLNRCIGNANLFERNGIIPMKWLLYDSKNYSSILFISVKQRWCCNIVLWIRCLKTFKCFQDCVLVYLVYLDQLRAHKSLLFGAEKRTMSLISSESPYDLPLGKYAVYKVLPMKRSTCLNGKIEFIFW